MRRRTFLTFAAGTAAGSVASSQWHRFTGLLPADKGPEQPALPVIDLHFGTMLGRGWLPEEQPNWHKIVSTPVTSGPTPDRPATISIAEPSGFFPGQLVCLKTADGEYRSAAIDTISGHDVRFSQPLGRQLAPDSQLHNFMANDSHANKFGCYTIADDALRQLTDRATRVYIANGIETWNKLGAVRFSENWGSEYSNPGTSAQNAYALRVEAEHSGDGIVSNAIDLATGSYRVTLPVSVAGATENGIPMQLAAAQAGAAITAENFVMFNGIGLVSLSVHLDKPAQIKVALRLAMANACQLSIGRLEIQRKYAVRHMNVQNGRHLLFGDSWIYPGHITRRLSERLPNTEWLQAGVRGNTLKDLLARFDRDVAPLKPNYVWVMCGTNDVYQMWEPSYFQSLVLELRDKISALGAQPIFWNPSVCNRTYEYGDRLAPSRRLAIEVDYGATRSS